MDFDTYFGRYGEPHPDDLERWFPPEQQQPEPEQEDDRDVPVEYYRQALDDLKAACAERDELRLRIEEHGRAEAYLAAERDEWRAKAEARWKALALAIEQANIYRAMLYPKSRDFTIRDFTPTGVDAALLTD